MDSSNSIRALERPYFQLTLYPHSPAKKSRGYGALSWRIPMSEPFPRGVIQPVNHLVAFVVKYLAMATLIGLTLGIMGGASLGQVLYAALILSAVAYVAGDLLVLRATSNTVATIVDALTAWAILRLTLPEAAVGVPLLASIIGVAVVEYFYHLYLKDGVLEPA